jgi:hypothetical protein
MKIKFLNYNNSYIENENFKSVWEYTILVDNIEYLFVSWCDNKSGEMFLKNKETDEIIEEYEPGPMFEQEKTKNEIFLALQSLQEKDTPLWEAFEHNIISNGDVIDTSLFDLNDSTSDFTEIEGAIIKKK